MTRAGPSAGSPRPRPRWKVLGDMFLPLRSRSEARGSQSQLQRAGLRAKRAWEVSCRLGPSGGEGSGFLSSPHRSTTVWCSFLLGVGHALRVRFSHCKVARDGEASGSTTSSKGPLVSDASLCSLRFCGPSTGVRRARNRTFPWVKPHERKPKRPA